MDGLVTTIIIPVGPRHVAALPDALASVAAQTVGGHATLIVNDSGRRLGDVPSWARVIESPARNGAHSRNLGLEAARTPYVTFLDADDVLLPHALQHLYEAAAGDEGSGATYYYGDCYTLDAGGKVRRRPAPEYRRDRLIRAHLHSITTLLPAAAARAAGGFDPGWLAWVDWEFYTRLAVAGVCGRRVAAPLIVYRLATGDTRARGHANQDAIIAAYRQRYGAYFNGERPMCGCGKGAPTPGNRAAQLILGGLPLTEGAMATVRMEQTEGRWGHFKNPFGGSGRQYTARPGAGRFIDADEADVDWLKERGFRQVRPSAPVDAPPKGLRASIAGQGADSAQAPTLEPAGPEDAPLEIDGATARPRRKKKLDDDAGEAA